MAKATLSVRALSRVASISGGPAVVTLPSRVVDPWLCVPAFRPFCLFQKRHLKKLSAVIQTKILNKGGDKTCGFTYQTNGIPNEFLAGFQII